MQKNGEIDLSIIGNSLSELATLNFFKTPLIVIRSTIVPGTTDTFSKEFPQFCFAFNPEFLGEKHAIEHFLASNHVVLGVKNEKDFNLLKSLYSEFLPNTNYFSTDLKTTETGKICFKLYSYKPDNPRK